MKRYFYASLLCILTVFIFLSSAIPLSAQVDMERFAAMKARCIGPAGMSGRIAAIDAVVSNPNIIYVGAATGGVWKSTSGGTSWTPIFDDQPASSIGAIAIYQPNPSLIWVGTGEGNPRNSMGVGYGIFKSLDGGETWSHLGLKKTERIHRILIDPNNPDVVYVSALGTAWGENPERGVFKTKDGGKTWKKVLFVNEKVGCADLVMDPHNPNKLFAAMWEYRRWPWFFKSGGPGSGLYVTYDGGENWKKITDKDGLPKGELGRIGIGIAQNNPDVIYALVEAKKNALYRSNDGGRTWHVVNDSENINPRPFYYCDIRVDPENENRLYSLHSRLMVSEDGGKSFREIARRVHSDHHELWINPENGSCLINGNDGGVAISQDRGQSWRFVDNLPLGQFYHINVDMATPYNIYGGMQDNGSWRGPSSVWETGGIRNYHWSEVGFGDGFDVLIHPADPNVGYSMSQGGHLMRFRLDTGERKNIQPDGPEGVKLRFHWNAGIAIDPHDPNILYYGSQFVHRSTDCGDSWEIISPDLTTDDLEKQKQAESGGLTLDVTNAENHTTIIAIAPSPVQSGVIWVGTDDGNVQVTTDAGKTWTNTVKNIRGLPKANWCPHIEASKFDAAEAFAVFDDHRRSNWTTYIYKTEDYGKAWKNLAANDPTKGFENEVWGFAHVIEQDSEDRNLLFLGTEFGLWISFNGGEHWAKWTHGVPTVPVRDLVIHPREHDLIVGTHGRAAFVLDDIQPLRAASKEIMEKPLHIFRIPDATVHHVKQGAGYHFAPDNMFAGENKPYGALITYVCNPPENMEKQKPEEETAPRTRKTIPERGEPGSRFRRGQGGKSVKIEILDEEGNIIRKDEGSMEKGMNRFVWDLYVNEFRQPRIRERRFRWRPFAPKALPGTYTVKITMGKQEAAQTFTVKPDSREDISLSDRKKKFDTVMNLGQKIEVFVEAVDRIKKTRESIDTVLEHVKDSDDEKINALKKEGKTLDKALVAYLKKIVGDWEAQGYADDSETIREKSSSIFYTLNSSNHAPTPSEMVKLGQVEKAMEEALTEFNALYAKDVAAFKAKFKEANIEIFPDKEALTLDWKPKKN